MHEYFQRPHHAVWIMDVSMGGECRIKAEQCIPEAFQTFGLVERDDLIAQGNGHFRNIIQSFSKGLDIKTSTSAYNSLIMVLKNHIKTGEGLLFKTGGCDVFVNGMVGNEMMPYCRKFLVRGPCNTNFHFLVTLP